MELAGEIESRPEGIAGQLASRQGMKEEEEIHHRYGVVRVGLDQTDYCHPNRISLLRADLRSDNFAQHQVGLAGLRIFADYCEEAL